ncbi:MAG: TetR/AcrR family transcriptional regulator, partial [Halioglobus sp.]|nr:TetR/AcrR family transcriptional regulator [Halioglobus sp.]
GCARSSVYRYFDNKDQLLGAVLQQRVMLLGAGMKEELSAYEDPREQIVRGLYLAVNEVRTGPSLELIATLLVEDGQAVADILLDYVADIATDVLSIDPVFQRAREAGLVRADITDEDILRWLVTIALSMFQQSNIDKSPEKKLAYLRRMLLPSIFVDA